MTGHQTKGLQCPRTTVCFTASEWGLAWGKCGLVSVKPVGSGPGAVKILTGNGSDPKYAGLFK